MLALRGLLALGCFGATLWAAAHADWEARVAPGDGLDVMNLGRHPVWSPPESPAQFTFHSRSHRTESRPIRAGDVVAKSVRPADVAVEAAVLAWPTLAVVGVLYLASRGRRRSAALHCAGSVALGQCVALVACVAGLQFWVSAGGWPHLPYDLFAVGILGGLVVGLMTYRPAVVSGPIYVRPKVATESRSPSRQRIPGEWPGVG